MRPPLFSLRRPITCARRICFSRRLALSGSSIAGRQIAVNVTDTRGVHQFVTNDVSPPGPADLFQYQSDGLLKQLQVITRVNTQIGNRVSLGGAYIWGTAHSDTDGTLCSLSTGCGTSTPVNPYDLAAEWSRSSLDVQNRMFLFGSISAPFKIQLSPFIVAQTGAPFNVTTGGFYYYDGLPDGIFNARPVLASGPGPNIIDTPYGYLNACPQGCPGEPLVSRNLGNGPGQISLNLRLSRTWGFGTTKFAGSSGGAHANTGGGPGGGGGRGGGGFGGFGGGRGGPFGGRSTEHRLQSDALDRRPQSIEPCELRAAGRQHGVHEFSAVHGYRRRIPSRAESHR